MAGNWSSFRPKEGLNSGVLKNNPHDCVKLRSCRDWYRGNAPKLSGGQNGTGGAVRINDIRVPLVHWNVVSSISKRGVQK